MDIFKYFPTASDRMGIIWTLSSIQDACIIEFGPAGTTHYAVESIGKLNGEDLARFYSTHMSETDITFGKYERLVNSIKEVDYNIKPKYIFVMASSVSAIIGSDIEGICSEIEDEVNAKLIPINIGGLKDDYNTGVEIALYKIAQNIVKDSDDKQDKYNIIGSNIDSFNFSSDCEEIKRIMKDMFNKDVNTIFTAYTSINEIEDASKANLNIVIRKEGLKAAKYMKEKFNIPYVYGKPIGLSASVEFVENIKNIDNYDIDQDVFEKEVKEIKSLLMRAKFKVSITENKKVAIFGDENIVYNLKKFLEEVGLEVDKCGTLHNTKNIYENIEINCTEYDRFKYLSKAELSILFADGCTLDMKNKSKLNIQISNPNLKYVNIYNYTPFIGFRGTILLIEKILSI